MVNSTYIYLSDNCSKIGFCRGFSIPSYKGELYIHADNTAEFRQKIDYQFEEDFKGPNRGTWTCWQMPSGFYIDPQPKVEASKMVIKSKILLAK